MGDRIAYFEKRSFGITFSIVATGAGMFQVERKIAVPAIMMTKVITIILVILFITKYFSQNAWPIKVKLFSGTLMGFTTVLAPWERTMIVLNYGDYLAEFKNSTRIIFSQLTVRTLINHNSLNSFCREHGKESL